jgi:DNA-binding NarL/FixJ family response regulator
VSAPRAKTRVLLVDDHAIVRRGLRALFASHAHLTIVGEAAGGREAVDMVQKTRPDIIVMDLMLPDIPGAAAIEEILRLGTGVQVVVLTAQVLEEVGLAALEAGARGFVLKTDKPEDIVHAIECAIRNEPYITPSISSALLTQQLGMANRSVVKLTPRERAVLRLLVQGKATKEIAHELGIGAKTVESHRANLMRKLSARSIAELVRLAIKRGLASV